MPRVRVIACGSLDAADDAAALLALRRAACDLARMAGVEAVEVADPLRLLDLLEGIEAAVLVDAVRTPGGTRAPGSLIRLEGLGWALDGTTSCLSSHGLGLLGALAVASSLATVPRIVFLGIEGADMRVGRAPTPVVVAAIPRLAAQIVAEVESTTGDGGRDRLRPP